MRQQQCHNKYYKYIFTYEAMVISIELHPQLSKAVICADI